MKILVTGGAGFIGTVTCETLLTSGHEVVCLDDLSAGGHHLLHLVNNRSFQFILADVRSEGAMRAAVARADAILPLAAVVGMPACDREPDQAHSVNVDAIQLLMRLRSKQQRVVFPNTNSGYGTTAPGVVCTEETPLKPISLYARLKAEAEAIVMEGENTVALRLATVFGVSPRMRRDLLVNDFVWRAMTSRRIEVFEGEALRNYVHVRDVADAFRACATAWKMSGVFNFGNDAINMSKLDLATAVSAAVSLQRGLPVGSVKIV